MACSGCLQHTLCPLLSLAPLVSFGCPSPGGDLPVLAMVLGHCFHLLVGLGFKLFFFFSRFSTAQLCLGPLDGCHTAGRKLLCFMQGKQMPSPPAAVFQTQQIASRSLAFRLPLLFYHLNKDICNRYVPHRFRICWVCFAG